MPKNQRNPAHRRPAAAQIRARQTVLLENAQKKYFTAPEFQVELLTEAQKGDNKVIFIGGQDKSFFIVNFVKEKGHLLKPVTKESPRLLILCSSISDKVTTTQWIEDFTDHRCQSLECAADLEAFENLPSNDVSVLVAIPSALESLQKSRVNIVTLIVDKCDILVDSEHSQALASFIADRKFQIVGITNALTGVGKADTARDRLLRLEKYFNNSSASVSNELTVLSKYGPCPLEKILEYAIYYEQKHEYITALRLVEENLQFLELFQKAKGAYSELIQEAMRYPMELAYIFLTLGPWCAGEASREFLREVSRSIDNLEYLTDIQISLTTLQIIHTFLQQFSELCSLLISGNEYDPTFPASCHPDKLVNLTEAISLYTQPETIPAPPGEDGKKSRQHYVPWHEDPSALCGLVIVRHRITAMVVNKWLEAISKTIPTLNFVKSNFIIGQTTLDGDDPELVAAGLTRQEDVLQKFRSREYNLLITTTATEDTLELPHCNLVIRFDPPESYKSYIVCKAKAKASSKCARFFIMLSQYETAKFTHLFSDYRKMENLMLERSHRDDITVPDDEGASPNDTTNSYKPAEGRECLVATLNNSIAIVNRYCTRLPSDTLTKLAPIFKITKSEDTQLYQCHLRLPINSSLKGEIVGDPAATPVLAKQSAALKTLELLHKSSEIDDHLAPVGKNSLKVKPEDHIASIDEAVPQGGPRPGTTKRRQYYSKETAGVFRAGLAGTRMYLYKFTMELECAIPEEQNSRSRKIFNPSDSPRGFGILSSSELPTLCQFPIYTRSGEVSIEIERIADSIEVSDEQKKQAEYFHLYVFRDVLRLEKFPMRFDFAQSSCGFLVVPILDDRVEWTFVERICEQKDSKPAKVDEEVRKSFKFNRKVFEDAVVMPWYRNVDKPQFFYVAQICDQLTPVSEFPASPFRTFDDYYKHKYDITICEKTQPLLDVDHTSSRLNLLTPRYVNRKGVTLPTTSEETRRARRDNLQQKQILVPELCLVHPFPASLWKKVVCLPCILYRMNYLLLSNELRLRIVSECGIGKSELPQSFKWGPLDFGWTLAEVLKGTGNHDHEIRIEKQPVSEERIAEIRSSYFGGLRKGGVELTPSGQLVIDTFDASKFEIPNDEELIEAELRDLSFPAPRFDWKPIPGMEDNNIRMGSPSLFEEEKEWDFQRDLEMVNIEMQGLEWISGQGVDINKLSATLPLQIEGEIDDSGDEGSLLEDMREEVDALNLERRGDKEDVEHNSLWLSPCSAMHENKILDGVYSDVDEVCDDLLGLQIQICKGGRMGVDMKELPNIKKALNYMEAAVEFDPEDQDLIEDNYNSGEVTFGELLQGREEMAESSITVDDVRIKFDDDNKTSYGPGPAILLQALTLSNANDGINLERLETVGDSFLKYAITNYLHYTYPEIHEGKLSFLRSKQISNVNLYRLGRQLNLASLMVATKFDPNDNWLPPGFCIPEGLEKAVLESPMANSFCNINQFKEDDEEGGGTDEFVSYSLLTHHSIPDKSIADCVEAIIGAYLISCGRKNTLKCMTWLGLRVLPKDLDGDTFMSFFEHIPSPLPGNYDQALLDKLLAGHISFEEKIGYTFKNRGYLLQAFTHASYHYNTLTECYQRLEFLGDAVLDYLITRYLYEDPTKQHSPGALTDLRSALVNNTFFAALAVKYEFHKYFLNLSPRLFKLIDRFVTTKKHLTGKQYFEEYYLGEDECEEAEEIEVPKALGDIFESVAGAIYLDSGMSLDAVWRVYLAMMKPEIEYFSKHVPKSPIRELLELEPQTAKFDRAEKTLNGKVRVKVEVFGKGTFIGIGRNKRIAKCTAAKRALRVIKGPRK